MSNITVPLDQLYNTANTALIKLGLCIEEASVVTEVLMYAQKRNRTQGLIKVRERTVLPDKNCTDISTDKRSPAIATVNGGGHTGMFVMNHAVSTAAELVRNCGIALVNTHNTRSSTGSIGYYASQLALQGNIALVMAGSPKVMAVEGGIDPVLGTNPVAIAIPTSSQPMVLDMATAATTWFALIQSRDNNESLTEGLAFDREGNPTTDPVNAMAGAMRTIAGAKGSGLALMFEMLTAPLAGASIVGDTRDNRANTIIAIDPAMVLGDSSFTTSANLLISRIKAGRTADNASEIRLPGEHSDKLARQCEEANSITLDEKLYQHICQISESDQ